MLGKNKNPEGCNLTAEERLEEGREKHAMLLGSDSRMQDLKADKAAASCSTDLVLMEGFLDVQCLCSAGFLHANMKENADGSMSNEEEVV